MTRIVNFTPVSATDADDVIERAKRRPRRPKEDRGLPDDDELLKLAETYLVSQRQLWPQLAAQGLLPEPTPNVFATMVEDFKRWHRGAVPDVAEVQSLRLALGAVYLAGVYVRFSSDNSNIASNRDQLVKCLRKAAGEGRFVPWQYVRADYAVGGRIAFGRLGYESYKAVLGESAHHISTTYIDDFSRASRQEMEWLRLVSLSRRLKKRLISVSDGFDLDSEQSTLLAAVHKMAMEQWMQQHRKKVMRGMLAAAQRGTCLGKPPLGFTRCRLKENGREVVGRKGQGIHTFCVEKVTAAERIRMMDRVHFEGWTVEQIRRDFNARAVDGWTNWTDTAIRDLLESPTSIGVFIWNRTRREYDLDSDRILVLENPREEWIVVYHPDLALVPIELWFEVYAKIRKSRSENPRTGRKYTRNEIRPSTLFSGLLLCQMGHEIKLIRSAGAFKQLGCTHGMGRVHGCTLGCSKSVKVVEKCLLDFLNRDLLTDTAIRGLVDRVNRHLEAEANKPHPDMALVRKELAKLRAQCDRLARRVRDEEDETVGDSLMKELKSCTQKRREREAELGAAEQRHRWTGAKLTIEDVQREVARYQDALHAAQPAASDAIRRLFGPIEVRQDGDDWIARFTPQWHEVIEATVPAELKGLGAMTRPATEATPVEVRIRYVPAYEQRAVEFAAMRAKGASIGNIAAAHRCSDAVVREALEFASSGKRPNRSKRKKRRTGPRSPAYRETRYKELAPLVVHAVDVERQTLTAISKAHVVCLATVRRAYDFGRPDVVGNAVTSGRKPNRSPHRKRHSADVFETIRALAKIGLPRGEIARRAGCSRHTVHRELKKQGDYVDGRRRQRHA